MKKRNEANLVTCTICGKPYSKYGIQNHKQRSHPEELAQETEGMKDRWCREFGLPPYDVEPDDDEDLEEILGVSEQTADVLSGMGDLSDGAYFALMNELEGDV
jgi:hypothetical protein